MGLCRCICLEGDPNNKYLANSLCLAWVCWRHAARIHLVQILRAQTRSQVSSRSVSTESMKGSLAAVSDSPDFFGFFELGKVQNFPASFSSSELSAHQMAPSGGVLAH